MNGDPLPSGWASVRLGDVLRGFESGRNIQAQGRPAQYGEFGVLKVSAVTWGEFNPEENKALLPNDRPRLHELVRNGDVLISRANTTQLVGAPVLVHHDYPNLMLPDKILRLVFEPNVIHAGFLVHALKTSPVRAHFENEATGTSDSMRNLSQPKIADAPILLPPLAEQARIVSQIESLTAKSRRAKEALDAVPALLERFRQSVLASAFRGDLTADWREKNPDVEPAEVLLKRIRAERRRRWEEAELAKMRAKGKVPGDDRWKEKYEEPEPVDAEGLPELPEGWAWSSFDGVTLNFDGDRIPLKSADRDKRPGEYPYYGASGIIDTIDDFLFDGSFLLIGEDGANLLSRSTPIAFDAHGRFWVNNHAHVVQPVGLPMEYLREFMNGMDLAPYVTGTAQPKLTQKNLRSIAVPIAPKGEADEIARLVSIAVRTVSRLMNYRSDLASQMASLDRSILSKAFRGELVAQDPSDEPASVLLERLRGEGSSTTKEKPQKTGRRGAGARKASRLDDAG